MSLTPHEQSLVNRLNEQYPRSADRDLAKEFRDNSIDRQVDQLMNDALNLKRYNDNKLMVPSDAELQYRANTPRPTNPDVIITREPLSEGLLKRDRPNPTPPTQRPTNIPEAPRTSPASPPSTPRTGGGGGNNAIDMQVAPPTAAPRQPLAGPNPEPGAKPSGLPGPGGGLAYPAAGAAVDFAFRIGAGQPLGQAAAGSAGSFIGSVAGAAAGSFFGPVGTFVGGMVGGYIGGVLGNALYNAAFPPTAEAPQDLYNPKTGSYPFNGGQGEYLYRVIYRTSSSNVNDFSISGIFGPIYSVSVTAEANGRDSPYDTSWFITIRAKQNVNPANPSGIYVKEEGYPIVAPAPQILRLEAYDARTGEVIPDNAGNPPPLPIPQDNRTPDSTGHPGNTNFPPRSATPPKPQTIINNQTNITNTTNPPVNNYVPGGFLGRSGGNARGDNPNWIPKGNPAGELHPDTAPIPIANLPITAAAGSPSNTGAPPASQTGTPNKSPFTINPDGSYTIVTPGGPLTTGNPVTNGSDRAFPSVQPTTIEPTTIQPIAIPHATLVPGNFSNSPTPDRGVPSGMPVTVAPEPIPDAYRETPVVPAPTSPPPTTTPTTPTTPNEVDIDKIRDEINKILGPTAIAIAGITALLNPIANNTTPEALRDAAATGTCRTTQPGGCTYNMVNDAINAGNAPVNQKLDKLGDLANLGANLGELVLLKPIKEGVDLANKKLGPILKGADGMSGFLSRLSSSLGIDRALNLIGIASNLHNAMMLSASLKVTLLEVLSSVGNATGLLQTSENENVDLNSVFDRGIETFMTSILGTENYAGLKVGLRKYNAIYRAATNSLNATSQMFSSIGEALETAAEYTGKIGNALRAASVVRENAYNFMSERITVKTSKFMTFQSKVGDVTQVLETINEIAENVVEGQQQYTEAVKATKEFKKALADADRPEAIDNKLIKEEAEKIKANLVKDPTGEDETGLLSFLTD